MGEKSIGLFQAKGGQGVVDPGEGIRIPNTLGIQPSEIGAKSPRKIRFLNEDHRSTPGGVTGPNDTLVQEFFHLLIHDDTPIGAGAVRTGFEWGLVVF